MAQLPTISELILFIDNLHNFNNLFFLIRNLHSGSVMTLQYLLICTTTTEDSEDLLQEVISNCLDLEDYYIHKSHIEIQDKILYVLSYK